MSTKIRTIKMEKNIIKGTIISNEELNEIGFNRLYFSYYVDAIVKLKYETVVFNKCKALDEEDGEETIYFTEGTNTILMFKVSDNPNMTIKKLLLN